jgi:glutamine amidotransferase
VTADRPLVAVLDYGIGNLRSAQKALERMGADARLTADRGVIADAAGVVLPGVGAFGACAAALRTAGLEDVALDAVASGRPFLGICIGMQLLFERSEEDDAATGLGVVPGVVRWIPPGVKRPQMQWNTLQVQRADDPLFAGLGAEPWMYFVHSLHGEPDDPASVAATCEYGTELTAAIRQGNVFATQFHPEKSGIAGLELLANFTRVVAGLVRS